MNPLTAKAVEDIRQRMAQEPLTADERNEFHRLWLKASVEASRQGVMLVSPLVTGEPLRQILDALRDGTWRDWAKVPE